MSQYSTIDTSSMSQFILGGGRINYFDALKCLGIVLVIEGHVWDFGMGIETYGTLSGLMFYTFNMPIFFFVSGFLAYKDRQESIWQLLGNIWKKFQFLVIPAVVVKCFMDLLHQQNPLHVFRDGFGGYWFTITLFECFLFYYVVAMLVENVKLRMAVLVMLAVVGIGLLSVFGGDFGPAVIDMNRLTKYFQYFVMGVLAMRYKELFEITMRNEWLKAIAMILFFALLFVINNPVWPSSVFHILRDLVLRYLGTFIVVSWFVCNAELFNRNTRVNKLIMKIGQSSLAIYLLQYFFIPSFMAFPNWVKGLDEVTVHVISLGYTVVITAMCMCFISLFGNSKYIKKYVLGQK